MLFYLEKGGEEILGMVSWPVENGGHAPKPEKPSTFALLPQGGSTVFSKPWDNAVSSLPTFSVVVSEFSVVVPQPLHRTHFRFTQS